MAWSLKDSASIMDAARWMLNDRASSDNLASYDRMKNLIHQHSVHILEQVGYEVKNTTVAATVGVQDYVLASGVTNPALYSITTDKNWPLERVSWHTMTNLNWMAAVATGDPRAYASFEDDSGQLKFRVWPVPNRSGTSFNVWYSQFPDSVNSAASGDGFTLEIASALGYVIARSVSIEVLAYADEDMCKARGLSKAVIPMWSAMVDRGIRDERIRRNRMSRTAKVELMRKD